MYFTIYFSPRLTPSFVVILARLTPSYKSRLTPSFVDLKKVIEKYIYHPDFLGSFSIKKVGPVLLGDLASYKHLEIGDGMEAMLSYQQMINLNLNDPLKSSIRKNLLRYCEQDTLLMVQLHQYLLKQIESI